jgi:hypothetical protein
MTTTLNNLQGKSGTMRKPPALHGDKAFLILFLFAGILLLDPLIPGVWENLAFLLITICAAWVLTEKGTSGRHVMIVFMCVFLAVLVSAVLIPKAVLESVRRPVGLTLLIITLALLGYSVRLLFEALWRATVVNVRQIINTVNLYLIIGMFWAYLYAVVQWFDANSFDLPRTGSETTSNLIYFSFVTLASLGYGDIVPKTPFAQRLAILEVIVGHFYTAVLVAYLLSLYIGRKNQEVGPS